MIFILSLLLQVAWATEACEIRPEPLKGLELEPKRLAKIVAMLKGATEIVGPNAEFYGLNQDQRGFEADLDNDGSKEILLMHTRGDEQVRRSLIVDVGHDKVTLESAIPFPFTHNSDPRLIAACGKNYIETVDGVFLILGKKMTRACTKEWQTYWREKLQGLLKEDKWDDAIALGNGHLLFCKKELSGADRMHWLKEMAQAQLKRGAPNSCLDTLAILKSGAEFAGAASETKQSIDGLSRRCVAEKPKPVIKEAIAQFPDLAVLFKSDDDATEVSEEALQKKMRERVTRSTVPDVTLRYPTGKVNREKTFRQWADAFWKVDPDYDTKANRYVMWRATREKSGEDQVLIWADAQLKQSVVVISLGLQNCYVGSKNMEAKPVPADLLVKLKDLCSEATSVLYYGPNLKAVELISSVKPKPEAS